MLYIVSISRSIRHLSARVIPAMMKGLQNEFSETNIYPSLFVYAARITANKSLFLVLRRPSDRLFTVSLVNLLAVGSRQVSVRVCSLQTVNRHIISEKSVNGMPMTKTDFSITFRLKRLRTLIKSCCC